ncbi:SSI family serine proteinase inhibitor [Arthrobacter sp. 24S4-2]|uniref:SSI family serine proteinase inhibitor n=1 Tax=Arthrobacter sp. 24S4-2 TaxID=2575374 RepID=UPI0034A0BB20
MDSRTRSAFRCRPRRLLPGRRHRNPLPHGPRCDQRAGNGHPVTGHGNHCPCPVSSPVLGRHGRPGKGNAELAIMVKPSDSEPAVNYTLVCKDGEPAAESSHPSAAAACKALKDNPAALTPAPRSTDQACTQQYGGPQQATVTGVVDDSPVDASFARRDGCEISLWNAAKDILGSAGGAS